jgi:hypothetical protein
MGTGSAWGLNTLPPLPDFDSQGNSPYSSLEIGQVQVLLIDADSASCDLGPKVQGLSQVQQRRQVTLSCTEVLGKQGT